MFDIYSGIIRNTLRVFCGGCSQNRYNLRFFYIMPSCYVYWPRCNRPELSKALEKKSVYIFFSLNDKMLRFKKLNKLMYQRVNARFSNILQGNSFAKN